MKLNFKDPTVISLVLANLITIVIAVWFSWNLLDLLWVYWWQSIIIGFFTFFKILSLKDFSTKNFTIHVSGIIAGTTKGQPKPVKVGKEGAALFFAFHYGFFHLGYAVFLMTLPFGTSANFGYVALAAAAFLINHLFSFLYYRGRQKKKQNLGAIMLSPYKRIVPMHFTMIAGGFLAAGAILLVIFLLLKTAVDVIMHAIEHEGRQPDKL